MEGDGGMGGIGNPGNGGEGGGATAGRDESYPGGLNVEGYTGADGFISNKVVESAYATITINVGSGGGT